MFLPIDLPKIHATSQQNLFHTCLASNILSSSLIRAAAQDDPLSSSMETLATDNDLASFMSSDILCTCEEETHVFGLTDADLLQKPFCAECFKMLVHSKQGYLNKVQKRKQLTLPAANPFFDHSFEQYKTFWYQPHFDRWGMPASMAALLHFKQE